MELPDRQGCRDQLYTFDDVLIEVPRETGSDAPRATWRLHGTLRVTTTDEDNGAQ